jgi:hypothetical protein
VDKLDSRVRRRTATAAGSLRTATAAPSVPSVQNTRSSCPSPFSTSALQIFDPITIIAVEDVAEIADRGMVDMVAGTPVGARRVGRVHHRLFEVAHELAAVLTLVFRYFDNDQ